MKYPDLDGPAGRLIRHMQQRHRRFERRKRLSRILISISIVLTGLVLLAWAEQQIWFSAAAKTVFWLLLTAAGAAFFAWSRRRYSASSFPGFYRSLAKKLDVPQLEHAFDLSLYQRGHSLKLHAAALQKNLESLSWQELEPKIDRQIGNLPETAFFRKAAAGTALSLLLITLSLVTAPDATLRTALFWETFQKPNPYRFTLLPGDTAIEQGSSFQPEITFDGEVPGELLLGIKTDVEEEFRFLPLREEEESRYRAEPVRLSTDAEYFVQMGEYESGRHSVTVQLKPRFEELTATVHPPSYTGLDSTRHRYPFSQVRAYEGSKLRIEGQLNKPVESLLMITASGDTAAPSFSSLETGRAGFSRSLTATDTLRFAMRDSSGLVNSNPFEITVRALQDEYPAVRIVTPEGDVEQGSPAPVEIVFEAADDFGLTRARLSYEHQRAFTERPETGSVELETPLPNRQRSYRWDIAGLNPRPRDVITFWIEVTDNDRYNGAKSSRSRPVTITLPSLVENLENLREQESGLEESLDQVSESYEQMQEEYERFRQEMMQNPEGGWEQQQTLEQVREQQEQMQEQMEEINRRFEEIREEMSRNPSVSEETTRAYRELQQLIEDINDPALREALDRLMESMDELNPQELREAMENFEFNEEVYSERLNRTLELLRTLRLNSDLEKIAAVLEELAEREGELSESTAPPQEQAEQQEAIQNDSEEVARQMEQLNENAPENARESVEQLQEESRQQMEEIRERLRENIERLSDPEAPSGEEERENEGEENEEGTEEEPEEDETGEPGPDETTRRQQQQLQQQFRQMAEQTRQTQQQMSRRQMQVNLGALQSILYSLVNLSEEQEELTQDIEALANQSPAFVEQARVEQNISRQFSRVADSLFSVSSEISGFSNQINTRKQEIERELERAVEQMAERNKTQSTYAGRESLGGINEVTSMVASLLDQLQQQMQNGMGGGQMTMQQFMEQLQNMSGDQQELNRQIQQMINDIQGNRLSGDQVERLNQMARQQNQIRRQLQELRESGGLRSGDQVLSELQRMVEQMEETINDLRGGQADRQLIERQQNILSRMLNAEQALQERGEEEQRQGTTPEDAPRAVPPDVTLEELRQQIREMLNDPDRTPFSDDYQRLIEQYFELLQEQE